MKKSQFYMILASLLLPAFARAYEAEDSFSPCSPELIPPKQIGIDMGKSGMSIHPPVYVYREKTGPGNKASSRDGSNVGVGITLDFPPIGEEWLMDCICIYNEDKYFNMVDVNPYDNDWNYSGISSVSIEIPEGTYDFLCKFNKIDNDKLFGKSHDYYYIIENREVKDGSVVEFKPWESTVCVAMETVNPDGERTRFPRIRWINEDRDKEIIKKGNIDNADMLNIILFKGEACATSIFKGLGYFAEPGPYGSFDVQEYCNFYVNPGISDRYTFREIRMMESSSGDIPGLYVAVSQAGGGVEGVYTNNPSYTLDSSVIMPTPASAANPPLDSDAGPARPYGVNVGPYNNIDGIKWTTGIMADAPWIWNVYFSGPADVYDDNELYYAYNKSFSDAYFLESTPWGDFVNKTETIGGYQFPMAPGGNFYTVYPTGFMATPAPDYQGPSFPFPGNPAFGSFMNKVDVEIGNTAPIFVSYFMPWDPEVDTGAYFFFNYLGAMGETLGTTVSLARGELSLDGEVVTRDVREMGSWLFDNPEAKGELCYHVETDNYAVDGLQGGNKATVSVSINGSDIYPPTLTMAQTRTLSGIVTQHFERSEDGELLISAADMIGRVGEPDEYGYRTWLEVKTPKGVYAACVPYGTQCEAADEIILTEETEGFYANGMGALYSGCLRDVTQSSPTGWYDLLITVEDENGNRQTQTISPAFKIDELADVGSVSASGSGVSVRGRDIVAPAGSRVYTLDGVETSPEGMLPGIYLVRTDERTVKVIVR